MNSKGSAEAVCGYKCGALPSCAPLAAAFVPAQENAQAQYEPDKALARGTLFPGLDLPFGNMVNDAAPNVPLAELMAIDFAAHDLSLYLDTHAGDAEAFAAYQDLLRLSVATASNDHRLGANEAPPAVVSIFLGDELEEIVDSIISQNSYAGAEHRALRIGVDVLPSIPQDTTDRNRTSPLAFTGNKFEFRMPGSSQSIAGPTTTINAIMADELSRFYDELSQAENFTEALHELVRRTFSEHRRIIFGGNGYEDAWVEEAERRGLANLANTAQALPKYILPKNIELMTRQGVYSKEEILSRHEIHMEKYCKVIRIEARTLVDMVQHEILDAVSAYEDRLCGTVLRKRQAAPEITCHVEKSLASTLAIRNEELLEEVVALKTALETEPADAAMEERVTYYHEVVEAGMEKVCETVNQLEALTATRDWPYPTFYKLLFSV